MLSTDEVTHIATLARIGLSKEETEHFRHDLSSALDWFEELRAADTSGVIADTAVVTARNVALPDRAEPVSGDEADGIRRQFPRSKDGHNKVRSVF
jgi:aspartyl/glutamyl-tRNA(Asn/Gln) amidotransferase C subunit